MNHSTPPLSLLPFHPKEASIGQILIEMGKITRQDAERILQQQKNEGRRFGEVARSLGLISDADIQDVMARQFNYPYLRPGDGNFSIDLAAAYEPFSEHVETLRAIRSQLMLRWIANGHHSLSVATVKSGEGASLFTANLAVVFAQLGQRILVIDANLRQPRQHKIFNLSGKQGLSDILAGRADLSAIQKLDTFSNLSILHAGTLPPNPQELINRREFSVLARNVGRLFDVVIYDVPALSTGADALTVAVRSEGVILLARRNVTSVVELRAAASELRRVGVELIGSVLIDF